MKNHRHGQTSFSALIAIVAVGLVSLAAFESLSHGFRATLVDDVQAETLGEGPRLASTAQAGSVSAFVRSAAGSARKLLEGAMGKAQHLKQRTAMGNPALQRAERYNWDKFRPENLAPAQEVLIKRAERDISRIVDFKGERTYENTVKALDDALRDVTENRTAAEALSTVASSDALFEALQKTEGPYQTFLTDFSLRQDVWNVLKSYAQTPDAAALDPVRKRHLQLLMDERIANGADLPDAERARVTEIRARMSELTTQMEQNVKESQGDVQIHVTDRSRLAGLPDSALERLASSAKQAGKDGYIINDASAGTVLQFADDATLRREVWQASNAVASEGRYDNTPLMTEMLALRKEMAERTGFADYVDRMTRDRMAKDGDTAQAFIADILERTAPKRIADGEDLLDFVENATGSRQLEHWDAAYYGRQLDESKLGFNEETVRPYFEMDRVVESAFDTIETLFGARIERTHDLPTWHKDARTYRIYREDGQVAGDFYLDLVARPGTKRTGAFQWAIRSPEDDGSGTLAMVVANVTPPADGQPVLLTPANIRTVYHELGHLVHSMLSEVPVNELRGTNVARDFVEFPSQFLQNWGLHGDVLRKIGRHYQTGEAIPEDLVQKILQSRLEGEASKEARTASLAWLDLMIHRQYDPEVHGPLRAYTRSVMQPHVNLDLPEDYTFLNRFGHLQDDGYAGGYYVYQWAGAHEADAFAPFEDDLFNPVRGRDYRDNILKLGNAEDPNVLFERHMGRPLDPEAFYRRIGVGQDAN